MHDPDFFGKPSDDMEERELSDRIVKLYYILKIFKQILLLFVHRMIILNNIQILNTRSKYKRQSDHNDNI